MKQLTKAEEQVMQVLWDLKKAYVRDIIDQLPNPKPAYNTVSTIVRILERKGFVAYLAYGKAHEYYPLMEKGTYRKTYFRVILKNYFGNSYQSLASFFTREQNLSLTELEEMKTLIESEIKRKSNL
ncbi:MAG: BlaI/MecI/CopY family transcriptional regulator [Bacteroidales bacterium]|nr:BlaI/MecI/CopY family transcriptional regulator [Bacteroidales bacterium]